MYYKFTIGDLSKGSFLLKEIIYVEADSLQEAYGKFSISIPSESHILNPDVYVNVSQVNKETVKRTRPDNITITLKSLIVQDTQDA